MKKRSTKLPVDTYRDETNAKLANFELPKDLSESTVSFSIIDDETKSKFSWNAILGERSKELEELLEYKRSKEPTEVQSIFLDVESEKLKKELFPYLLPALEKVLHKAVVWNSLESQRTFFNGIDYLAECLWNNHPEREKQPNLQLFNMKWVQHQLKETPRQYYPKSWLWSEEYAAIVIQRNVRKFLVQKRPEVNEMRNFWKKLQFEKDNPEISSNPLLAKYFAYNWDLTTPKIAFINGEECEKAEGHIITEKSVLNLRGEYFNFKQIVAFVRIVS